MGIVWVAACGGQSVAGSGTGGAGGTAGQGGAGGAGTAGSTSAGGTGGSGGSAGSGGTGGVEGSYDLLFKGVVAMRRQGSPPTTPPPSEGASVRLDLRRTGAALEAVVTPRWGTPAAYAVTESSADLKLTGAAQISGSSFGYLTDKWTELHLARDAGGGLTGGVQGSGEEMILMGDVIDMATLTTGGSLAPDGMLPELRSEVSSPILPADQLLPWEPIRVRAVEGIAADKFTAGLSVVRANPDPNAPMPVTHWITEPTDATSWAGAVTAAGRVASWDEINGIPMQVRATGAAVVDRAGHNMATSFSAGFTFFDVNLAQPGYPLGAAPTAVPPQWGDVVVHGMTGADPACESGVCLVLGPFDNGWCGVGRRGVAGRLGAPRLPDGSLAPRAKVRVRYRVLAGGGISGTPMGPAPFTIDIAAHGADTRSTEVVFPTLRDLGAGELRYASDFVDAFAPGPDGASGSEFGFAIYAGTRSTISCGPAGGLLPPPFKVQVILDAITIEPG